MTPSDRDPLDALRRLPDPEPDRETMRTTIAASREAFARGASASARPRQKTWRTRLSDVFARPSGWLAPAGAGAVGLVIAVAVLPNVLTPPDTLDAARQRQLASPEPAMEREAPAMNEAQPPPAAPQPENAIRLDAAPPPAPAAAPAPADAAPADMAFYAEDGLRLGYRLEDGLYTLFLMTGAGAVAMDDRAVDATTIEIVDALRIALPDGPEIIAVRTRTDAGTLTWDAYTKQRGDISRDEDLSALIADATDATEVETRIRALG